jgi:hypothetical protein
MKDKIIYKNDWINIYYGFDKFSLQYCTSFYFDQRHLLIIPISLVVALIGLMFTGFSALSFIWLPLIVLPYGKIFLHFPWRSKREESCEYPAYGFYISSWDSDWYFDSLVLSLGLKTKFIYMPWSWNHCRTSVWRKDSTWEHELKGRTPRKDFWQDQWKAVIYYETHPYTYTLKGGAVQKAHATCHIVEREWRWKALMFLPWPNRISRKIDIDFDREMGERSGSWKGGTVGCSWPIKPGDTILEALRQMEKQRNFR